MLKKYLLNPIIYTFILGFIIIEEYAWNKIFKHVYLKVKDLKLMIRFKYYLIYEDNRYLLLLIFLLPFILMEGFSILGLLLIGKGLVFLGVLTYVFKLLITIPVVIIFNSAKKKLLTFFLIKFVYFYILKFKRSKTFRMIKSKIRDFKMIHDIKKDIKDKWSEIKTQIFVEKKVSFKRFLKKVYYRIKNSKTSEE